MSEKVQVWRDVTMELGKYSQRKDQQAPVTYCDWSKWDLGKRGNSYKSHVSAIAESDSADGDLIFVPPLYSGSEYGIMYVHTGENLMTAGYDWKELNISTMPRDDM